MKNSNTITQILGMLTIVFASSFTGGHVKSRAEISSPQIGIIANLTQDRVVVSFKNKAQDPYTISIVNVNGKTLHSETAAINGHFIKRFDLGELPDGEYTIKVTKNRKVESLEVLYINN